MKEEEFVLKIIRQHWIKDDGIFDCEDVCSHGEVFVKIANEILSDEHSGSWSLSTAGLYLLRSLNQDCDFNQFSNQLIPCCGDFMIPDENGDNYVTILGCPKGIDFKITHREGFVHLETINSSKIQMPFNLYKNSIIKFVNLVEEFYGNLDNKKVEDEMYRKCFKQFWAEWYELKNKWI